MRYGWAVAALVLGLGGCVYGDGYYDPDSDSGYSSGDHRDNNDRDGQRHRDHDGHRGGHGGHHGNHDGGHGHHGGKD